MGSRVSFLRELARRIQADVDVVGLGHRLPTTPVEPVRGSLIDQFDDLVTSQEIRNASRKLLADGHAARAVEEAFKCLNNAVKQKSRLRAKDGADLMRDAFSANSPVLKLNDGRSQSQRDEQRGYMDLFAGVMTGIRNPRAHDHKLDDQPDVALELIILANHLMRRVEGARRSRVNRAKPNQP